MLNYSKTVTTITSIMLYAAVSSANVAWADWSVSKYSDEMSDKVTHQAQSNWTSASKKFDFPYADAEAALLYKCVKGNRGYYSIAIFGSISVDGETGINSQGIVTTANLRVKWDGKTPGLLRVKQSDHNQKVTFLRFTDNTSVSRMLSENSVWIEIPASIIGGTAIYKFDLAGANNAVKKVNVLCGK